MTQTLRLINYCMRNGGGLRVKGSWHDEYKGEYSSTTYIGKSRGFGFLMYEDQRSTVLAVDNMNGIQVMGHSGSSSSEDEENDLDEEDPMAEFIRAEKKKEVKKIKGNDGDEKKRKHEGETKEERRARKEAKRAKKIEKKEKKKRNEGRERTVEKMHPIEMIGVKASGNWRERKNPERNGVNVQETGMAMW
ncbi:hypothetical protein I307_05979 [Cryptococcus deuterogattii 99/473]|uniref:Unplaced genomic scaffold supercont1.5, whole genome shotgun sequence n=1 Tax=Cryptococcus deuterogattii Ram5 TaxID=1296110 RepID=A0A0D0U0B5_9TREE|nr:hypothetical protein I309_01904 [Cryptococcus deuterogattii LA55]KIR34007.1 hypothetical protein I352_03237 [Cryptococcus deuterogattii MMRL2647]KIR41608.1 hypothetical protein I313_02742 [Cryptococcus deuterogattii Ram5]KIR71850.1 hypothetical protein I310_04533 [Cryptococcus deuterogattii CA1014]KIR91432.1 hypothetical protein I304_04906 [Cryptococcus deuterogattii CBS 10090]KIR98379.1 hypothetical protein L804_03948 [Cryptococcus deuterogattii 2001/935-1]KIY54698.1 hypothetical protein 